MKRLIRYGIGHQAVLFLGLLWGTAADADAHYRYSMQILNAQHNGFTNYSTSENVGEFEVLIHIARPVAPFEFMVPETIELMARPDFHYLNPYTATPGTDFEIMNPRFTVNRDTPSPLRVRIRVVNDNLPERHEPMLLQMRVVGYSPYRREAMPQAYVSIVNDDGRIPGDASWSCKVDEADFNYVKRYWGSRTNTDTDLNKSGMTEQGDLDLVLLNWGNSCY